MLAKTCVTGATFGRYKTTDMLCVGYYAGNYEHAPEWEASLELQDIYCRLDRNIADLIRAVDEKVGIDNALFFITSTGYSDVHMPDSKILTLPTGELKMDRCVALLNMYLGALYGSDNYVEGSYLNEIYLNHAIIEKKQLKRSELLERCIEFFDMVNGVKQVHTSLNLLSGNADVKVRGAAPTDGMKIGAFYGTQLRGTGEWIDHKNIKLMQFRIYSSYSGNAESGERIRFYCYEKDSLMLKRFPEDLYFDGETHGSLKEPFKLTLP